ncbi:hypothetical protein OEB99_01480 [Actinotalea sp. M2MS4P-6]|uniref:hypothetical protein n=1 Tax=Actinotalea sp. M2MS4P-6 TaxID=2983762 RepID=UPI0021E433E4|nr:hypothetical protein [Actinotalea sp. M2MS4P-6]MCV2392968.1 hypothetical protein [Actinotalea sp. M2MS4P-6]
MLDAVEMAMNAAMEPIFRVADADTFEPGLPPDLEELVRAGLVCSGGRLYLARPEHKTPPPGHLDAFESELWMNKVHLDTRTPASDPSWRIELLRHGLTVARRLLPQATTLTQLPVQIVISLQSAPDALDPETDFATGAVHLALIRSAHDDFATGIADFEQPVLAMTATAR